MLSTADKSLILLVFKIKTKLIKTLLLLTSTQLEENKALI